MLKHKSLVSVVIPVFNEADNIRFLSEALAVVLEKIDYSFEVIFIDDGSKDGTIDQLRAVCNEKPGFFFIQLSRNFGHQNAVKAGLDLAKGDCIISMDGDGQHPPALIPEMIAKWEEGFDVVYTRRLESEGVKKTKKYTSNLYYKLVNRLSDVELEEGTADFRLINKRVAEVLRQTQERDLFFRGLVKWIGLKQYAIDYVAPQRFAGETKYTLKKMLSFGLKGVTSFSTKPLYIATYLGLAFAAGAALYIPYILYSYYMGHVVSGWSSLIATIVFFGGLQLMILGIIGIYLGKTFIQTKGRPHYLVQETNIV